MSQTRLITTSSQIVRNEVLLFLTFEAISRFLKWGFEAIWVLATFFVSITRIINLKLKLNFTIKVRVQACFHKEVLWTLSRLTNCVC